MLHLRVGNPAAVHPSLLLLPNLTAAPRRSKEVLVDTLTTYLAHAVQRPNLYTNILRHVVYLTSRRLYTNLHGVIPPHYITCTRKRSNIYSNILRHLVYQTSRRLCTHFHGGTTTLLTSKLQALSLGYAGRSRSNIKFNNYYCHYLPLRRHLTVHANRATNSSTAGANYYSKLSNILFFSFAGSFFTKNSKDRGFSPWGHIWEVLPLHPFFILGPGALHPNYPDLTMVLLADFKVIFKNFKNRAHPPYCKMAPIENGCV